MKFHRLRNKHPTTPPTMAQLSARLCATRLRSNRRWPISTPTFRRRYPPSRQQIGRPPQLLRQLTEVNPRGVCMLDIPKKHQTTRSYVRCRRLCRRFILRRSKSIIQRKLLHVLIQSVSFNVLACL